MKLTSKKRYAMKKVNSFSLLIISLLLLVNVNAATVSHPASEITAGTFGAGDFAFQGKVGIGTTAPTQRLDVVGYVKGQSGLCIGNDCRTSWPSGTGTITQLNQGGGISLSPNPITSTGTISLATQSCPAGQYVTSIGGAITCATPSGGGGSSQWAASGSNIYNTNSGNVGIGTTGPGTQLTIQRTALPTSIDNPGANAGLRIIRSGGTDSIQLGVGFIGGAYQSWIQSSHDAGTKDLLIQPNGGNVGIGTTNPQAKLHVFAPGVDGIMLQGGIGWGDPGRTQVSSALHNDQGGSIELGAIAGGDPRLASINPVSGGTPYIDMHYGTGAIEDYNTRIINRADNVLAFQTRSGGEVLTLNGGNVGIGTSSPSQKLEVAGIIKAGRLYIGDNQYGTFAPGVGTDGTHVAAVTNGAFYVINSGYGFANAYANDYWISSIGRWASQLASGGGGQWQASGSNLYYNNGNVGIGTSFPTDRLHVVGNFKVSGGNTVLSDGGLCINNEGDFPAVLRRDCGWYWWTAYQRSSGNIGLVNGNAWLYSSGDYVKTSDARLKDNIVVISSALDKLSRIRGVSFEWNELAKLNVGQKGFGVIAQDVEAVFPELVTTPSDDGYKSVNYDGLTAPLIEAVKELKTENDALKARNDEFERRIGLLEAR